MTTRNTYKPDDFILFKQKPKYTKKPLREPKQLRITNLSDMNKAALIRSKKESGLTWNEWAIAVLELIKEHG